MAEKLKKYYLVEMARIESMITVILTSRYLISLHTGQDQLKSRERSIRPVNLSSSEQNEK